MNTGKTPLSPKNGSGPRLHSAEPCRLDALHAHPANYRQHPADQLEHLAQSLREHGVYRNVVIARDGTILAGHGVVEAARLAGLEQVMVVQLDLSPDDPKARKLLAADNEISHLSFVDDRALAELLKEIRADDIDGLFGTGYDDDMLANLIFVTRPEHEVGDRSDAAAWVGLPEYEQFGRPHQLVLSFENEADRQEAMAKLGITTIQARNRKTWSARYPPLDLEDVTSVRFVDTEQEPAA
jgi:ParB-like chromosome segregation protein Spo0J